MKPLIIGTDFSGLGSPEEAFKRLQVQHEVAFACEKDEFARKSYSENHSPGIFYDDVTTRNNAAAPYVDFYAFGFPCQAFSISGKRLGFEDTRGTLFFNSLEYIATHRPRVIVAENVKGLLSHDKVAGSKSKYGRTFGVIRDALGLTINGQHNLYKYDDCINYHIHFQVLNTKEHGLPQNRERIFIVGFRDEADSIKFRFPKKIPLKLKLKDLLQKNVAEKYYLSEAALSRLLRKNYSDPQLNPEVTGTLNAKNNSAQLGFDNGTTFISDDESIIVTNNHGQLQQQENFNCIDANYGKGMDNHGQRSLIMEPQDFEVKVAQRSRTEGAKEIRKANRKNGIDTNPFEKEITFKESEVMNTITTSQSDDQLILIEEEIIVNDNTKKGFQLLNDFDSIDISQPNSTTRRGRVSKEVSHTVKTNPEQAVLIPLFATCNNADAERIYSSETISRTLKSEGGGGGAKTGLYLTGRRIRRLIPLECFRLQGYSDAFFERCAAVNSDTQLYKQAGNSISIDTFMNLLIQILQALNIPYVYDGVTVIPINN